VTRDGNEGEDHDDLVKKRKGGHRHHLPKDDCSRPENEDKPHCEFKHKPRYASKNSPSRRNGPLSPLGYTQFYLPKLDSQLDEPPKWQIEYTTLKARQLLPANATQPSPVPVHLLPGYDLVLQPDYGGESKEEEDDEEVKAKREKFEIEMKRITPWGMKDLTIGSYVKLARKLVVERKMWNKFSEFMLVPFL